MNTPNVLPANEHDAAPVSDQLVLAAINALRSYEYGNAAPDLAKAIADQLSAARAGTGKRALTYPAEMTPELHHVLGMMCFQLARYAHLFRSVGADIKTRAEDEQAYCLHWLIKHVLAHGAEWASHADADVAAAREKIAAIQEASK
ncbi:hypothetical protein BX589_101270 [Paraburkholderia fungorum]|uniref:hypothetical protein n=1 Tax=Paraburkholderia fungorum TaxID=134537 RepID=UPI000D052A08|nr:hypothetical protein [Paraburkholderia fungorum]PRZ56620.1 hypothetical protein BX589_101270 [Paraburkholderia fungorum]